MVLLTHSVVQTNSLYLYWMRLQFVLYRAIMYMQLNKKYNCRWNKSQRKENKNTTIILCKSIGEGAHPNALTGRRFLVDNAEMRNKLTVSAANAGTKGAAPNMETALKMQLCKLVERSCVRRCVIGTKDLIILH